MRTRADPRPDWWPQPPDIPKIVHCQSPSYTIHGASSYKRTETSVKQVTAGTACGQNDASDSFWFYG